MKRFNIAASDTVRFTARDVTHATTGPVTSGLTGNVTIYNAANALVGTYAIASNNGDDWYVDVPTPAAAGLYRMVMLLIVSGAQRTLEAELRVA